MLLACHLIVSGLLLDLPSHALLLPFKTTFTFFPLFSCPSSRFLKRSGFSSPFLKKGPFNFSRGFWQKMSSKNFKGGNLGDWWTLKIPLNSKRKAADFCVLSIGALIWHQRCSIRNQTCQKEKNSLNSSVLGSKVPIALNVKFFFYKSPCYAPWY